MSQPFWKLVYATDYSALYVDETGIYPPELAIAQTDDDANESDIDAIVAYVYRFRLDRCYLHVLPLAIDAISRSILVTVDPARTDLPRAIDCYEPWYARYLGAIGDSVGASAEELTAALCSDDAQDRARAYEAIGNYHGFDNLDSYPQQWTEYEFAAWPERGAKLDSTERDAFTTGYIECALWCGVIDERTTCSACDGEGKQGEETCDECEGTGEIEPAGENYSGDDLDESDLDANALESLTSDAHEFYAANVADLRASALSMERAGHDFWLTRNRHGAGFWDDKSYGATDLDRNKALDRLTEASHAYGEAHLVLGNDGKVGAL